MPQANPTDIVEHLGASVPGSLSWEAGDKIKRLRAAAIEGRKEIMENSENLLNALAACNNGLIAKAERVDTRMEESRGALWDMCQVDMSALTKDEFKEILACARSILAKEDE